MKRVHVPLAFRRNEIVQPQLTIDFFQPEMNGIIVKLSLRDTSGGDGGR
jgi:hypothetical protein